MMMSFSISKGKGNVKHNQREQEKKPKNVDFSKTHLNVILENNDIRQTYSEIFQQSVDEYNSRQKRNDRKITDYYSKVAHDKKTKTFHELVIQIGSKDKQINNMEITNDIYSKFLEDFKKVNPQMKVIGAYIHNDETTPHMHLDYIPVAKYSRGMKKRVSNDKAIHQMGYRSWNEWKDKQFDMLEAIAKSYNIEREVMNNQERHQSVVSYKEQIRLAERQMDQISVPKPKIHKIFSKKFVEKSDYDAIAQENAVLKSQNKALEGLSQKQTLKYQKIREKPYIVENERLNANLKQKENEIIYLEAQISHLEEQTAVMRQIERERDTVRLENKRMLNFLKTTGLYEIYQKFSTNISFRENLKQVCQEIKERAETILKRLEIIKESRSIRDRMTLAKKDKSEYRVDIINAQGDREVIQMRSKATARRLAKMLYDNSGEHGISLANTEANQKLLKDMKQRGMRGPEL